MEGCSLVVCCYNSVGRIESTLRAICAMSVPAGLEWELIIVDNASSDNTGAISRDLLTALSPPIWRVVREEKPGLMYARLRGAAEAQFGVVCFIDDDNWPDPSWLVEVAATAEANPAIGAFGGWCTGVGDCELPCWFESFAGKFACGPMGHAEGVCVRPSLRGAGLCVRKKAWSSIESLLLSPFLLGRTGKALSSGDDDFICQLLDRHNWKLYYNPRMHMMHYMPKERLTEDYLLKIHEGIGRSSVRLRPAVLIATGWPKCTYVFLLTYYKLRAIPGLLKMYVRLCLKRDKLEWACAYRAVRAKVLG